MTQSTRIGVVLSSSGGRGRLCPYRLYLALERLGIEVSAIAGCSVGALVGGVAASGANLHHWAETITKVRTREYWTPAS